MFVLLVCVENAHALELLASTVFFLFFKSLSVVLFFKELSVQINAYS